jgi:hypothetical protein
LLVWSWLTNEKPCDLVDELHAQVRCWCGALRPSRSSKNAGAGYLMLRSSIQVHRVAAVVDDAVAISAAGLVYSK